MNPKTLITLFVALGCWIPPVAAGPLLLHYSFDEANSGNAVAVDFGMAPPAPGTFFGGATRTGNTPGGFSVGALDLTAAGAGTYVDGGDADKLDSLSSFTLSAWINLQDVPAGNLRIMSKQGGGTFPGFSWNVSDPPEGAAARTAANFGLRLFIGGDTGFAFDPAPTALNIDADNKWAFIAVSYDGGGSADNVNYYVGTPAATAALASTTTVLAGAVTGNIARFGVGFTDAAPAADTAPPAYMDDIRVYSGVLTPAELEVVRLANVIPEPSSIGLLAAGLLTAFSRGRRRKP